MTIALAGRRIDAAGAKKRLFPLENARTVAEALHNVLDERRPKALVSSCACGADLLALHEAGKLGIRRRVVLPFPPDEFLQTSVIDRPGEWRSMYERVIRDVAASDDLVIVSSEAERDDAYLLVNIRILDEAAELAKASDEDVQAVLVWDGHSRGPGDFTDAFRQEAERRGYPVLTIRTNEESQNPSQRAIFGSSSPN